MARQDRRETVHFDPGDGTPACGQLGSVLVTTDPELAGDGFTMCGRCMRQMRRRAVMRDSVRTA